MKPFFILLVVLVSVSVSAAQPDVYAVAGEDRLTVDETVIGDQYTLFERDELVQYPAGSEHDEGTGEDNVDYMLYENMSVQDWMFQRSQNAAASAIETRIDEQLGEPRHIMVTEVADRIVVTLGRPAGETEEWNMTADTVSETVPSTVESTIYFETLSETHTFPVTIEEEPAHVPDPGSTEQPDSDAFTEGVTLGHPVSLIEAVRRMIGSIIPF